MKKKETHLATKRSLYVRQIAVLWVRKYRPDVIDAARAEALKMFPQVDGERHREASIQLLPESLDSLE